MSSTISTEQQFHSDLSKNVRVLESARRQINIKINDLLRNGKDEFSLKIQTKVYLLIYSAWTEACLVKLIHTPFGFTLEEKKYILKDKDLLNRWKKCVNTAFLKFNKAGSDLPNKKQKIHKLLDNYLKTQANIRNKIAHGQWEFPLYSNNLTHDAEVLHYIQLVDTIQIDTWFEIFKEICGIVVGLIDARSKNNHRAHYYFYFEKLTKIQNIIDERKSFSLADKKILLQQKPSRSPNIKVK